MIDVGAAVSVIRGDLSQEWLDAAVRVGRVAWDIETSGLDWRTDRIGTCQLGVDGRVVVVVLDVEVPPVRLGELLERHDVTKVFHHAPFDLRFMAHQWRVAPVNVACTKIASKILDPRADPAEHSLMPVLRRHLSVHITKDQQVSDWLAPNLTDDQVRYAAADVAHLLDLLDVLTARCEALGLHALLRASFEYLPSRVALDLHGSGDVYSY
ncbi:hypothetical protein NF556_00100 [Ornithinimicrobium faecis]|uniref:3'-5' exonuclease domain-containing protein n=1 Tax=Ornithinimicrobium faecis TaxID=2934158 RepID=A0ABY4YUR5_9MICO|nr:MULTISPECIES: hypothetical protein [Ornithinimicrobium]USQ80103.1 hypothetical protein NF556_00100 [Ornithinimicrobium sp. HY1793]